MSGTVLDRRNLKRMQKRPSRHRPCVIAYGTGGGGAVRTIGTFTTCANH